MRSRAPALVPALALLGGVVAARETGEAGTLCAVLVLLLCGALSARLRWAALASVVGCVIGALGAVSDTPLRGLDLERPVEMRARLTSGWARAEPGWRGWLRVLSVAQGGRVVTRSPPILVYLPGEENPPFGTAVSLRGYLQPPSESLNGPSSRPGPWRITVASRRLLRVDVEGPWEGVRRWSAAARQWVERRLDRRARSGSDLARGLLLGDVSRLPFERLMALRRLGLGHLVAVSGLHLGLLTSVVWICTWALGYRSRLCLAACVVVLYLGLVGPRPSLLRSSLMALVLLTSLATERRPNALNSWALAAAGMVVVEPSVLDELAFQLTAAATLGLITMTPSLSRRWSGILGSHLATALAASVAAHVATLPWSIAVFNLWSPGSILLNLVAIPWTAVALPTAALAVLLEACPGPGDLMWRLFGLLAEPYGWIALIPVGGVWSFPVSRPFWCLGLLSTGLAVGLTRLRLRSALLLSLGACAYLSPVSSRGLRGLEMVVLDVGQGEAILIRDGSAAVLVDGGGWRRPGIGQRVLLPALLELGVDRLQGIVLTHPDRDHCAGLVEVANLIPVRTLWSTPGWDDDCYRQLTRTPGAVLSPLWRGRRLTVGRWVLEVLHPPPGERLWGNDSSLVVRAVAERWKVLLTADVGARIERRLLREVGEKLPATVLKVAHHGSRSSSEARFLDHVSPRLVLISAGRRNAYGHPAKEVLARLEERRIDTWRTDRGGQIRLRFDGEGLHVEQPWGELAADCVSYNSSHGIDRRRRRTDCHR